MSNHHFCFLLLHVYGPLVVLGPHGPPIGNKPAHVAGLGLSWPCNIWCCGVHSACRSSLGWHCDSVTYWIQVYKFTGLFVSMGPTIGIRGCCNNNNYYHNLQYIVLQRYEIIRYKIQFYNLQNNNSPSFELFNLYIIYTKWIPLTVIWITPLVLIGIELLKKVKIPFGKVFFQPGRILLFRSNPKISMMF